MRPSVWGEGLYSRYYFGGRVALRRNSLVYEVVIHIKPIRIILTFWR